MSLLPILLHTCILFAPMVFAVPTVTFPLNSQVPPVARASKPFTYTFSPSTFSSKLPLTYTLSAGPTWLKFDGTMRTLHGTPSEIFTKSDSVIGIPISITASDSTGSTFMNSTLVVTNKETPSIKVSVPLQLASFGTFSSPSTLLYYPSSHFDFKFNHTTFSGDSLQYYAVADGNTPLPPWVTFDSKTLSFIGQTPTQASLTQSSLTIGIQLIASDVEGFAGTSISFEILVRVHMLTIIQENLVIEAVLGEKIDFMGLLKAIQIDSRQAERREVELVVANTPDWLKLDNDTLALTGTLPQDATNLNITFFVTDIYKDTISATILVNVSATKFFKAMVGSLNATVGCSFWYNMSSYLNNVSRFEIDADFTPKQTWISFDSTKLTISGVVPETFTPGDIMVELHAKSKLSQEVGTQTFNLLVSDSPSKPPSPSATTTSATSRPTLPLQPTNKNRKNSGLIAVSVPLAVLGIVIFLAIICYLRGRKKTSISNCFTKGNTYLPREQGQSNYLETATVRRSLTPALLLSITTGFGEPNSTSDSPVSPLSVVSVVSNPVREPRNSSITRPRTLSETRYTKPGEIIFKYSNVPNSETEEATSPSTNEPINWISTAESTQVTLGSFKVNYSHRLVRRYSRRHRRHPATTLTSNDIRILLQSTVSRPITAAIRPPTTRADDLGIDLQDIDFSFLQLNNYLLHSKHNSTDSSQLVERPQTARSSKSYTRLTLDFSSPIGIQARDDSASSVSMQFGPAYGDMHHQDSLGSFGLQSEDSLTWLSIGVASTTNLSHRSPNQNFNSNFPDKWNLPNYHQHRPSSQAQQTPPSRNPNRRTQTYIPSTPIHPNISSDHIKSHTLTLQTSPAPTSASTTTNCNWMRALNSFADSPTMPMSTSHSSFTSSREASGRWFSSGGFDGEGLDRVVSETDTLPSPARDHGRDQHRNQNEIHNHGQTPTPLGKTINTTTPTPTPTPYPRPHHSIASTKSFQSITSELTSDFPSTGTSLLDFPLPPGRNQYQNSNHFHFSNPIRESERMSGANSEDHNEEIDTGREAVLIALQKEVRGNLVPRSLALTGRGGGGERKMALGISRGSGNKGVNHVAIGKGRVIPITVGVGVGVGRKRSSKGEAFRGWRSGWSV